MARSPASIQIPVVAVACLAVFLSYVLFTTGYQSLTCERFAPGSVQCESVSNYLFGLVTRTQQVFRPEAVEVKSELRDRTPRGGVRFRHTVVLQGQAASFSSNAFRSPLSSSAIRDQVQAFIHGDGPQVLTFQRSAQVAAVAHSSLLALLLSVVAWGFWDVRWPPRPQAKIPELEDEET